MLPGEFQVLTKYTNAPHPFVLSPPIDSRTVVPRGSRLDVDVALMGAAQQWFPHFLFVFDTLGRRGQYGGPYRLDGVNSNVDGRLLYDGRARQIVENPPVLQHFRRECAPQRAHIDFLTPLRMRTGGEYNGNPDFVAFAHGLLGRLHLLSAIYGGGSPDRSWMRELLARADEVRTVEREWRVFHWDRQSGRQGRRVSMDGVLGGMTVEGDLGTFEGVLRMGEVVHVGSGTSMGMGRYRVRWEG